MDLVTNPGRRTIAATLQSGQPEIERQNIRGVTAAFHVASDALEFTLARVATGSRALSDHGQLQLFPELKTRP